MAGSVRVYHAILAAQTTRLASRYVGRILDEILAEATSIAAVGPYTTGELARSIYKAGPMRTGRNVIGNVGSKKSYAKIVEGGAKIHNIFPKRAPHVYRFGRQRRPTLKFEWHGRTVYPNQVPMAPGTIGISHPGQKGKGFLIRSLRNAAVRHRMQIIVREI
jgi:hypothetical protein